MTGRASVWSDPRVIELASEFIATTDEVGRLQSGEDPESLFFQEMANQGHAGGRPGSSRQGIYVCAPSGRFLASVNHNSPDRVLRTMRAGLVAWQRLPADERRLVKESVIEPRHRWENSYPEDGLVVNVFSRDLPEQCEPNQPCASEWNQDFLWFSRDEARGWLGRNPQPGDEHAVPDRLVARVARFHLVDNVKGETPQFSLPGVAESRITTHVVDRSGSIVKLKIEGTTQGSAGEGWWQSANGVVTRLLGRAEFDLRQVAFTEFEIVALGRRWGYTRFNGRRRDPRTGPLGFVFRLSAPNAPRVAPTHIASYQAEWVVHP